MRNSGSIRPIGGRTTLSEFARKARQGISERDKLERGAIPLSERQLPKRNSVGSVSQGHTKTSYPDPL